MQEMTRAELLQFTPEHYLANGYTNEVGMKRPGLSSLFATAASTQLLAAELAPQELAFTAEAIRQLLPGCDGAPVERLAGAIPRMRTYVPRALGQPSNPGLAAWLEDCAEAVVTEADLNAFLDHLLAVQRQYGLMVGLQG